MKEGKDRTNRKKWLDRKIGERLLTNYFKDGPEPNEKVMT